MRNGLILLSLLLLALASMILSLMTGSVDLAGQTLWQVVTGQADTLSQRLIVDLRWPRAYSAFTTGALLALAGSLMQVLLRNPLADPYILGVSGGAAAGTLISVLLGAGVVFQAGAAWAGALLTVVLVFVLANKAGQWNATRLLLTGVVVAAGWGALISLLLAISPEAQLRGMLFWLMGDIPSQAAQYLTGVLLLVALIISWSLARPLNLLVRGQQLAQSLGVSTLPLQWFIYILAALLTAAAVTQAGSIGFVGLIVPHMVRLMMGSDHRVVLPAVVLLGGSLLLIADTLARTVLAPQQLPTGVLTALVGVPVFLYLLRRGV